MAMLVRPAKPGACPLKRASPPGRSRSVVRAQCDDRSSQPVGLIPAGVVTGLVSFSLLFTPLAHADLNRREADLGGEFDRGSAKQYGEMDIIGEKLENMDLRRSNFTSANARNASFKGSNLQGAYFIKAVTANANFEGANLSDVLMDRAVMVGANLKDAILERAVFTRSDLTGAIIDGADFTNAMLDKPQQIALCRYADGVNPKTGISTRKSLGCGSAKRFKASTPSNPEGPQVTEEEKEAFRNTLATYRQ